MSQQSSGAIMSLQELQQRASRIRRLVEQASRTAEPGDVDDAPPATDDERRDRTRRSLAALMVSGDIEIISSGDPDLDSELTSIRESYHESGHGLTDLPTVPFREAGADGDPLSGLPLLPIEPKAHADPEDLLVFEGRAGEGEHRTLNTLLRFMIDKDATDLRLQIDEPPVFRIDGEIRRLDHEPLDQTHLETYIWAIVPEEAQTRLRARAKRQAEESYQDASMVPLPEEDLMFVLGGTRFRCNLALEQRGPMLSVRRLPATPPAIADYALPAAAETLFTAPYGLVLIGGPTSGGKSTTMASIIDEYARRSAASIISIEEPIEYQYPPGMRSIVVQRQVGRDTESYASGLRYALRQDPDVIVIGEILDTDTMQRAIMAARTGHLVFSTIHAGNAAEIPQRVVDMFPAAQAPVIAAQLASVLKILTFQQLLPRTPKGRVAALEIIPVNTAARSNINDMKWQELPNTMKAAAREGKGRSLMDAVAELIEQGHISVDVGYSILTKDEQDELRLRNKF